MIPLLRASLFLFLMAFASFTGAQTIKKCQDANGNWHYGDYAAQECEKSKVVREIDKRGLLVKDHEPPPTAAELEAKRLAEEREKEIEVLAAEQRRLDERLLSTYDSVAGIESARDQRVAALEQAITVDRTFLEDLEKDLAEARKSGAKGDDQSERIASLEAQVSEYKDAIEQKMRHRNDLIARYNSELQRFRDLTERSPR